MEPYMHAYSEPNSSQTMPDYLLANLRQNQHNGKG